MGCMQNQVNDWGSCVSPRDPSSRLSEPPLSPHAGAHTIDLSYSTPWMRTTLASSIKPLDQRRTSVDASARWGSAIFHLSSSLPASCFLWLLCPLLLCKAASSQDKPPHHKASVIRTTFSLARSRYPTLLTCPLCVGEQLKQIQNRNIVMTRGCDNHTSKTSTEGE